MSARYREEVRIRCTERRSLSVVVGVVETVLLMLAEVVAVVLVIRWLLRL